MDYIPESRTPPSAMPSRQSRPSRPIAAAFFQRGPERHLPSMRPLPPPTFFPHGPHGPAHTIHFIQSGPPKTRNRIRPHQLARLERLYAQDTHPPTPVREALGREIGLELKTVTIWFQNKRQTVKKEQAAIAAAAAMQRGGTPEGSSDSDYFESPHSSHPSSAHSSSHSSTPYSSQPSVYHNVLSVEESPIHGRHLAYSTRRASFTNTHDFSRPHHHPYQRSPSSRSVYSTRPGGSSLPSTMASPVGPSFTLDQACALQSSSQSYPHTEEDELDDDIEIMDGPPDLSPTHVTNFSDRNYTWKIEGENGDMDVGPSGDSADEMEVVTPSASMHSIPCILNNSPPRQVSKYSEEMVDAAIVLCRLGRDQC